MTLLEEYPIRNFCLHLLYIVELISLEGMQIDVNRFGLRFQIHFLEFISPEWNTCKKASFFKSRLFQYFIHCQDCSKKYFRHVCGCWLLQLLSNVKSTKVLMKILSSLVKLDYFEINIVDFIKRVQKIHLFVLPPTKN
jgi:hypothetical protein